MAVKVVIDSFPSSISTDAFDLLVTISGAKTGTNYLRAEIYKDGTTRYFGETLNGNDWYGGSDGLQYFPVEISGASSSATFKARIGNPNESDYTGSGEYKLKIKRYTSSGSAASGDEMNPVTLQINYQIQTPMPTSTLAPTPILSPTLTPIPRETILPTYFKVVKTASPTSSSMVLAESIQVSPEPTLTNMPLQTEAEKSPLITIIFIIGGILFFGVAFWPIAREKFKAYNVRNAQKSN